LEQELLERSILDQAGLNKYHQIIREKEESDKGITQGLVEYAHIDEKVLAEAISSAFRIPAAPISGEVKTEIAEIIPEDVSKAYRVFPLFLTGDELTVAFIDPPYKSLLELLRRETGYRIVPVVTTASDFASAVKIQRGRMEKLQKIVTELDITVFDTQKGGERRVQRLEEAGQMPSVSMLVDELLNRAVQMKASDIHIEPAGNEVRVRFRIDGVLRRIVTFPQRLHMPIVSVIKAKGNMDLFEKTIPLDGRSSITFAEKQYDLRISTLPTIYGEKVVMRILDKSSVLLKLADLGFSPENLKIFRRLVYEPDGIILVTGPTGSGKTTTLYAALSEIRSMGKNIVTIENPVEYKLDLINQVQVNPDRDLSFANAMRSILRQDPDIILVGEIRDSETGVIATEAALTGHLVLSTLHTNDSIGAIPRLLNIGIPTYWLAPSLMGIVAQRLVRRICDDCKDEYRPPEILLRELGLDLLDRRITFFRGIGCRVCDGEGYRGRTAMYEIFVVDEETRDMIYTKATSAEIREVAVQKGFRDMRFDGLKKVLSGETTVDEVVRVTRGAID
jgi:type IV pilus assembly protein PilB